MLLGIDLVGGQNRGKRIGSVEDFIRQGQETAEGTLAFPLIIRRFSHRPEALEKRLSLGFRVWVAVNDSVLR